MINMQSSKAGQDIAEPASVAVIDLDESLAAMRAVCAVHVAAVDQPGPAAISVATGMRLLR